MDVRVTPIDRLLTIHKSAAISIFLHFVHGKRRNSEILGLKMDRNGQSDRSNREKWSTSKSGLISMEGHSGQKCNLIVTCIPLDRTRVPLDRTFIPLDRTFLPLDRTSIPLDRTFIIGSYLSSIGSYFHSIGSYFHHWIVPFFHWIVLSSLDRTFLPLDRNFLPFHRTSIILSLAILHWFIPL